jgi:hypothetical protein
MDAQRPAAVGEFIASHRLDNLGSTFSGLVALISSEPSDSLNVLVVFDHEEIGSDTAEGARGTFLQQVLKRLVDPQQLPIVLAKSYGISCDAAQGYHPNFPGKFDPAHAPKLGAGVSLKRSPGYLYATDLTACRPVQKASAKLGSNLDTSPKDAAQYQSSCSEFSNDSIPYFADVSVVSRSCLATVVGRVCPTRPNLCKWAMVIAPDAGQTTNSCFECSQ